MPNVMIGGAAMTKEDEQQSDGPHRRALDLSVLDGLRCLSCLSVVFLHVHYFYGGVFFPSSSWCMQRLYFLPVVGKLFFSVSFHMTIFWLISGFLCQYQLVQLEKRGIIGIRHYGRFLLNRLLRLYPLYASFGLLSFFGGKSQTHLDDKAKCLLPNLLRSLVFAAPLMDALYCVGIGWSAAVDVHGYIAIVLLSAVISNRTRRKYIFLLLYIMSLVIVTSSLLSLDAEALQRLERSNMIGFDTLEPHQRAAVDPEKLMDYGLMYPEVDLDEAEIVAVRALRQDRAEAEYFTSIGRHGSAIFLGCLLYLNLLDRNQRSNHSLWKLAVVVIISYLTKLRYSYTGISLYLLVDVLLSINPDQSPFHFFVYRCLSNRFWTALAPYTYGIYFVHALVIFIRRTEILSAWAAKGGDPCDDYTVMFLLIETTKVATISTLVSVVLHYTIEWPFSYARRRWLKETAIDAKKTKFE